MTVPPRGYLTTWAGGNPQLAPEIGLAPACHGHTDPGPIHRVWATILHPKITAFTIQVTDGTMGASAQVLDQESQQEHQPLERIMALVASPKSQLCHCPQTLSPLHSHVATSHLSAPSPSLDSNRSALTRMSRLWHWLMFHWHWQPLFSMHLPQHCQLCGHPKTHFRFNQRIWGAWTQNVQIGTIRWRWEDDQGMVHDYTIPDSYYIPDGQVRLLSPQHWIQKTMTKQEWCKHSHSCTTKHEHILLTWKGKFVRTTPLDKSNAGTFTLAPGYKNFEVFAAKAHILPDNEDDHPILLAKGGKTCGPQAHPRLQWAITQRTSNPSQLWPARTTIVQATVHSQAGGSCTNGCLRQVPLLPSAI